MFSPESGAEIRARSNRPSIDLATLVELVAQAIPTSNNTGKPDNPDPGNRQALLFDAKKKRLKLCTSAVLLRLFKQQNFLEAFDPREGGFIQDLQMPGYGFCSRIGGYLTEGNAARLPAAVDRLISALDRAIDAALPEGTALSSLLLDNPEQQLRQLAQAAGATFNQQANTANLVPLAFKAEAATTDRDKPVAKLICATEQVETNDYFERMCSAVREYLQQRDFDEDDIEAAVDSLTAEKERAESQIIRFLNFLDDEALSRVRLLVTLRIMEAIADNARTVNRIGHRLLAEYVSRVINLLQVVKEVDCTVDLTAHYGVMAEFALLEYISKATFYSCLPVWSEWKTQILEEKVSNQTGTSYGVARKVSYRFRVNGDNPEFSKPAFEARLDRIEEELLTSEETSGEQPGRFRRRLAELIFLALVVPRHDEESLTPEALSNAMQQLLASLRTGGKATVRQILADLRQRATSMKSIATALISILRDRGGNVISQVQQSSDEQFICVKRSIFQWSRLEGAEPGVRDLLIGPQQSSREQVEWFKHIEICDRPETPALLFSVKVTTEIVAHNLVSEGEPHAIKVQRLLPQQLLQICWVPFYSEKNQDDQWTYNFSPNALAAKGWLLPTSINIEYEARTLTRRQNKKQAEESKQYHAAVVAAFVVLVYSCLWRIIQRLKQPGNEQVEFTTLMLRLQETRKSDEGSGDAYVYAAAQTIEAMLAQDTSVRMQGLALENLIKQDNSTTKWVKRGTFDALLSAFPIAISTPTPPSIGKIGLISYANRPCNETPLLNSNERSHLFLTQSYVATAVKQPFPGYELKAERMQSDIVDSPERLQRQRLVQEEIGHLQAQGCQHIILLSHAYGGRRINRIADYHSSLTSIEFLEEVLGTFPDLTIYTMLRDVFSATRLRSRAKWGEAAFEILQAGDHTNLLTPVETVLHVRDLIPVYTFATLYVIEEQRPQSGFCSYFLISDRRVSNINWTERPRQHLIDPERNSIVRPCLITVLRGLHFIEAERGVKGGQLIPVLDPFSWISPTTIEAAGDVQVLHTRRKGQVLLSYRALLNHIATVLHRRH
jgi:hypothetical protein